MILCCFVLCLISGYDVSLFCFVVGGLLYWFGFVYWLRVLILLWRVGFCLCYCLFVLGCLLYLIASLFNFVNVLFLLGF